MLPELQLDERTHHYSLDGTVVINVTRAIKDLTTQRLNGAAKDDLEHARERGLAAERAVYLYLDDNLDEGSLDPVLEPYLTGWKRAAAHYQLEVISKQEKVYHPVYRYAGTYDLVVRSNNRTGLIMTELKCVDTVGPETALQLAAYQDAYNFASLRGSGERARHRLALQLLSSGDFAPVWYTDKTDLAVFVGCLNRLNWRIKNGFE
jgi:hypothetical protein